MPQSPTTNKFFNRHPKDKQDDVSYSNQILRISKFVETKEKWDGDVEEILQNQTFINNLNNMNYADMMLPVAK